MEHLSGLRSLAGEIQVSFLCDVSEAALERAKSLLPGTALGTDLDALVKSHPCDLLVLCLPPFASRKKIAASLGQAPHLRAILVEKPAAASVALAEEAFGKLTIPVFLCHQMRLLPWFEAFQNQVAVLRQRGPVEFQGNCLGKLFDQGIHLLDLVYSLVGSLPEEVSQVIAEEDPARVSAQAPVPANWRVDRKHPGPVQTNIQAQWTSGDSLSFSCGPNGAPDWLDKKLRVQQGEDWVEITTDGVRHGGPFFAETENIQGSTQEYLGATTSCYREIRRWLLEEGEAPRLPRLQDHLPQMSWCENIERFPQKERLPKPHWIRENQTTPQIGVVIPLSDHRNMAPICVRSWTQGQEAAPDDFQLILIANRDTRELGESLRPFLRDHDLILQTEQPSAALGQGDMEEYVAGIEATDSEWLFLTEPHCEAPPELTAEIRHYFENNEAAGFCSSCTDGYATPWGRMEALFFGEGFHDWRQPGHWAKMVIRGFGIRRKAYELAGGLRLDYGRFSEWLLAGDLHRQGLYIAHAPGVRVIHHYTPDKIYLDEAIEEFVKGQAKYLLDVPEDDRLPYFPNPPLDFPGALDWRELERKAVKLAGHKRAGWLPSLSPVQKAALTRDWNAWLVRLLAWWNPKGALPFFARYYEAQTLRCLLHYLELASRNASPAARLGDEQRWEAQESGIPLLPGMFQKENYQGKAFHWAKPVFGIPLTISPQAKTLELSALPLVKANGKGSPALLCSLSPEKKIEAEVERDDDLIKFQFDLSQIERAESSQDCWVGIMSQPIEAASPETRELALPVTSISLVS